MSILVRSKTRISWLICFCVGVSLFGIRSSCSYAAEIEIPATNTGFFFQDSTVEHTGYFVGRSISGGVTLTARNYFLFDLPDLAEQITGAQLKLFNPTQGYLSGDSSEVYTVFDVTTDPADILSRHAFQSNHDVFLDLGSGVEYGQVVVDSSANGNDVVIDLSAAVLQAIGLGSRELAIGGAITTLGAESRPQYLFGFTLTPNFANARRIVTTVPERASGVLGLLGLLAFPPAFWLVRRPRRLQ